MQNLCVARRWRIRLPLTIIHYNLQPALAFFQLFLRFSAFASPSKNSRQPAVTFSKSAQQTPPRRGVSGIPRRTFTRPAARSPLSRTGGTFATVHFDFDIRARLIRVPARCTKRDVPYSNEYERRSRCIHVEHGQRAQFARATHAAVARASPDERCQRCQRCQRGHVVPEWF